MLKDDPDSYTQRWNKEGEIAFAALPGGKRLRYLKTGKGPVLVLLHTLRTQLDYFQHLIPLLEDRFTIYAVDLPAFGWSDITPGADYEEPALRKAVVDFVEALDLRDITFVGESIGATLALTASTELRDRVRQVIALNTYDYPEGVERANFLASLVVKSMRVPVVGPLFSKLANPTILGGIMGGGFHDPARLPKDFVREQIRSGKRPGYAKAGASYYRALPSFIAARHLYPRITVPVTLVYGDHDWSKPEARVGAAHLVPGCRMITLRDVGHFSSLERPDEIARLVTESAASIGNEPKQRSA